MGNEHKEPFSVYSIRKDGCLIPPHLHAEGMELLEILDGQLHITIGTTAYEGCAGDFFYIPRGMVHTVCAQEGGAVRGLVFDTSILEENMLAFDTEVLYMFYVQSQNKVQKFSPEHEIYHLLHRYMEEAIEEFAGKDVCYKLPIRANIYLLMTALLRYYCGSKDEADRMVYHNVLRLRPVMEYIDTHYTEKIYIEKLSGMIMISADYFTKMFKESIGKTPIDYINGLRVNHALSLLAEDGITVAQIAEQIGFCNGNYFHKIFKQYMGQSPLAYRKAVLALREG